MHSPANAVEWMQLEKHGDDASRAFEALTGQLFERFCRREYRAALREVRFVSGKGGDGGVEAYATLGSGDGVGFQAKWFRGGFGKDQVRQIEESLRSAKDNHPRLVRFVVAIPRNLGDVRDKLASGSSPTRSREKPERQRWVEWIAKVKTSAPGIEILLWDEAKLSSLLSDADNEGLIAYWFTSSTVTLNDLERGFEATKGGWLNLRYFPNLHAPGILENELALRLGAPTARAELVREVRWAVEELSEVRDDVARLAHYPVFITGITEADARRDGALAALKKLIEAGETLATALQTGFPVMGKLSFSGADKDSLQRLHDALKQVPPDPSHVAAPTSQILDRLRHVLGLNQAHLLILDAWERWERSAKIVAFLGPPGVGKTHGLARAVEARLDGQQPALLLRAKDCLLHEDGWAGILRKALDRPDWRLETLFNALEALAVRTDVRRAHESACPGTDMEPTEVGAEPTCFLLAVDGLEESGRPERWAELLGELATRLQHHPRIRVAVTLRTSSQQGILSRVKSDAFTTVVLPRDGGNVQALLAAYCKQYAVPLPERRLRWAIRDPLSVRLYCEAARTRNPGRGFTRQMLALPNLLMAKLAYAEKAVREKGDWSEYEKPLAAALHVVASHTVQHGALPRIEAIAAVRTSFQPPGILTSAQWSLVFEQAVEHGLLLVRVEDGKELRRESIPYVEPAYEPLTDYLIAEIACDEICAPRARNKPALDPVLANRPDALTQAAILLAKEGMDLITSGLWKDDLPEDQLEILQLRAIAALDDEMARPYSDWVRGRLLASLPSCRRVLAELCIPVARDEAHPFGPHFVHQTLLPILPAIRDLVWSGPSYSSEDGAQPGEGDGLEALELLKLEPEDRADGPPLLLAWALTSVDERWRRRLRAELSQWGAGNLDEVVRWLDLAMQTNDPQMAEDVAMAAYGASCLAGADSKLAALAAWVDENLLAPDARLRREDIVVLHAARGIVARASFMGANVESIALEHASQLYSTTADTLPIDAAAAKEATDHWGIRPITGDLAWYVVPGAIRPFFYLEHWEQSQRLDVRAERILGMHAAAAQVENLTPQKLAFGVVAAHLREVGYEAKETLGWPASRSRRYERGSHGIRSQICSRVEKYVWTGCHELQAYLASRAPAEISTADGADRRAEPPVDPLLVSDLIPNPASDVRRHNADRGVPSSLRTDDGLTPKIHLEARIQADMADEWTRRAPTPDLRPLLRSRSNAVPSSSADEDWVVLFSRINVTEPASQAESHLFVSSFVVPTRDAAELRREGSRLPPSRRQALSKLSEGVRCRIYADPFDAAWAPWVRGFSETEELQVGRRTRVEMQATVAGLIWQGENGETRMSLPAHWLRKALRFAGVERRSIFGGEEWRFVDRRGDVQAIFTRTWAASDRREILLIKRESLSGMLTRQGKTLVWAAWLNRHPSPHLYSDAREKTTPWEELNREWLAFLAPDGNDEDVVELPPFPSSSTARSPSPQEPRLPEPRDREPSSPVLVGPTNPGLATRLELDLDDDDAIPYFLWDDPMTVRELRARLSSASPPERDRLLGKILREARDPDVWRFTTPGEVAARFDALSRHLGRRRAFWKFLMSTWKQEGLLVQESA
jgi:hypothetical protein